MGTLGVCFVLSGCTTLKSTFSEGKEKHEKEIILSEEKQSQDKSRQKERLS